MFHTGLRTHYVSELSPSMEGKEVVLCGWVHEVRNVGKIIFLLLRDSTGIVQVIGKAGVTPELVLKSMDLQKESVIAITGTVKANKEAKKGFEIYPSKIENLNPLNETMPFDVASKIPADLEVRLDYRYVDLRRSPTAAIFSIQSTLLNSFRDFFVKKGFQEVRTPSVVGEATEGGADLFSIDYFERKAYLAQSPQLYKQLAVIGGIDKVFMIVPVFRAEKFNTIYHLNESTQMDIEIGFADYNDAIKLLKGVAFEMIKRVALKNREQLEALGIELNLKPAKEVTYTQAIKKLNENGIKIDWGEDLSREAEQEICKTYGDLTVVKFYPTKARAFYSMPNEKNPEISNSYDLLYKGLEVSSGAQRIHKPDMLVKAIEGRGLNPAGFKFYIDAFKRGAPPHAGWSIGLERFTMQLTEQKNIRECSMFPRDRTRLAP
ncbi:MAG: aspartate--tRNA(Asn) ligase [Candidatus Micrarchaeia archaeon]